jgi:FixJ family two-component response regulator
MSIPCVGVVDDREELCLSLVDLVRSVGYRAEPFDRAESLLEYAHRLPRLRCLHARHGRDQLDPSP